MINQTGNFGIGNIEGGVIKNENGIIAGVFNGSEQNKTLAEAAKEIEALLQQLDKSYPSETLSDQMNLAQVAIKQVEENPTLVDKTLQVLRAGGSAALKQMLDHPAATFLLSACDEIIKIQKEPKS
ncbi:MAG: hypothetical protein LAT50_14835 [Ectothiorhodospiraceae bacterium]|nr:hypothetical protein [Ectothiorhodospiraceae bacterium]